MIVVKGDNESIYETVFFVLRTDVAPTKSTKDDMLIEANKIISNSHTHHKRKRHSIWEYFKKRIPAFFSGTALGTIIGLVLYAVLT